MSEIDCSIIHWFN